jgi:hypothetical protein
LIKFGFFSLEFLFLGISF